MNLRQQIAECVERHLDEIVDETMRAYLREIPAVAKAPMHVRQAMRTATARTTLAFLRLYADSTAPARPEVDRAREATFARAGEHFAHDDIAEVVRVGRQTIYGAARRIIEVELNVSPEQRDELQHQLDAFLDELARRDADVMQMTPDMLSEWLARAEREGPDIR
jgi:hypothetical protein